MDLLFIYYLLRPYCRHYWTVTGRKQLPTQFTYLVTKIAYNCVMTSDMEEY